MEAALTIHFVVWISFALFFIFIFSLYCWQFYYVAAIKNAWSGHGWKEDDDDLQLVCCEITSLIWIVGLCNYED